ncbi:eCIS core domain-containing protein [Streptomyces vinaceus]|uniref:eCIS core domain-containing protein n=1 Tax=Streptomyces vinaceus TaxID=1960 RepID=UPI00381EC6FE
MKWPFRSRRRGGAPTTTGPSPDSPPGPTQGAPLSTGRAAAAPRAWVELPPLEPGNRHLPVPLTAVPASGGLHPAPAMLASGGRGGQRGSFTGSAHQIEPPTGKVTNLVRIQPLRHLRPPAGPAAGPHGSAVVHGLSTAAGRARAVSPAHKPEPYGVAVESPPAPVHPAVRRRAVERSPEPAPQLIKATKEYLGEPRPATDSAHMPAWMRGLGSDAPERPADLAALLFGTPSVAPVPTPEKQPDPNLPKMPEASPTTGPLRHTERPGRRNLGSSRRLGLGTPVSHTTPDQQTESLPHTGSRPPPVAAADLEDTSPDHAAQTAPRAPAVAAPLPHFTPTPRDIRTPRTSVVPAQPPAPPAPPQRADEPQPVQAADVRMTTEPHPSAEQAYRTASRRAAPLHHRAPARASVAPTDLARVVSALHGVDVSAAPVHRGPGATAAASAMSARAFTRDQQVFLPDSVGSTESADARGLIAHELTHVAQQKRYGGSLPAENSPEGRFLEAEAIAAERYFRGDPGAPAPLVHRRPVTSGVNTEEIRDLVAQMLPGVVAEPEAESCAEDAGGHVHSSAPDMSWTPSGGLVGGHGVQRAGTTQTREQVIQDYLDELNHMNRHRPNPTTRTATDLTPAERELLDFRVDRMVRRGALETDAQEDPQEPLDWTWWGGQVGLGLAQDMASPFRGGLEAGERDAVRRFFGGTRPAAAGEPAAEARPPSVGAAVAAGPDGSAAAAANVVAGLSATTSKHTINQANQDNGPASWQWLGEQANHSLADGIRSMFGIQESVAPGPSAVEAPAAQPPKATPSATKHGCAPEQFEDEQLDVLGDRLYPRLRSRLRDELLIDRERSGRLHDFG